MTREQVLIIRLANSVSKLVEIIEDDFQGDDFQTVRDELLKYKNMVSEATHFNRDLNPKTTFVEVDYSGFTLDKNFRLMPVGELYQVVNLLKEQSRVN